MKEMFEKKDHKTISHYTVKHYTSIINYLTINYTNMVVWISEILMLTTVFF